MRHITLAAATLAALALAGAAYADSNYGPRKNGDQCWHGQGSNSIGYWGDCRRTAQQGASEFTQSNDNAKAKAKATTNSKSANTTKR
jgi:hypothetical protein